MTLAKQEQVSMKERILELERIARRLEPGPGERAELFHKVFDHSETFLENLPNAPAYQPPDEASQALYSSPISAEGMAVDDLLQLLGSCVERLGVNTASARQLAFIPGGPLYHSALGDFLADVSNRFTGHFYGAPGAIRVENMLLRWMAQVIGFPATAAGNLTSGGSIANLIAVVTAREAHTLKAKDYPRSVVYLTEQAHHSVDNALRISGLGECVKRLIDTDERHRMIPSALEAAVREDHRKGLHPWLVVAAAGSTNTGAVDPLETIADIAARHQLWFHTDGAYGAFFALCAEGKKILKGIEASDSVTLDPHKGLFLPYGSGAVLVKEYQQLHHAFSADAAYLQDVLDSSEEFSPYELSPELSRPFRGLRLWLPLKLMGTRPFEAALEEKLYLARYFYHAIQKLDRIEVGPAPDLSIVTFRFIPRSGDINAFNEELIQTIQNDGRIYLSSTTIGDRFIIRLAVLGFQTHLDTIEECIDILRNKSKALMGE